MQLQTIFSYFKLFDKNNDSILDKLELQQCKGTIWEGFLEEGICEKSQFVACGLDNEMENTADEEPQTAFDRINTRLIQLGIHPVNYIAEEGSPYDGFVIYSNGAMIYTREIQDYKDLPDAPTPRIKNAKGIDISKLNLTKEQLLGMVIDNYTTMSEEQQSIYNQAFNNCNKMGLGIDSVIEQGFDGCCTMALIDQEFCGHKSYSDKIQYSTDIRAQVLGDEKSWHCAAMLSIMNKTSPKTDIVHYCAVDTDTAVQDEQFAKAIEDIIEKNKTLPDDKKIRTIIMGWGFYPNNPKYQEYIDLCKRAVESGIFICSNNTQELYGIDIMGTDREALGDVNSPDNYKLVSWQNNTDMYKNRKKEVCDRTLFIPQQHLVIAHEDGISYQYEGSDGGACWSNSVGALYNNFLSADKTLTPQQFMQLLIDNADDFFVEGVYCGKILNAERAMQSLISH